MNQDEQEYAKRIGAIFREKREALKISQRYVGSCIGRTGACIALWEAGSRKMSFQSLVKLCLALEIKVEDLLLNKKSKK